MFSEFVGVDGCRAGWIAVNLAPTGELSHEVDGDIGALLARHLPQRLVDALLPQELARRKAAELSRAARQAIVEAVQKHSITPSSTAGLKKAEACSGGVNTDEVDPKTMRSRVRENLFVVGELLDVTGLLGGYNLHWAWASGSVAAKALARHMSGCGQKQQSAGRQP